MNGGTNETSLTTLICGMAIGVFSFDSGNLDECGSWIDSKAKSLRSLLCSTNPAKPIEFDSSMDLNNFFG